MFILAYTLYWQKDRIDLSHHSSCLFKINTVHRTEYHLLWWAVIQCWRSMAKECEPEYTHGVWLKVLFNLTNRPIYEFQKPSLSKWGQGHNLSSKNEFYLYVNEKSFPYERLCTKPHLFWYRGLVNVEIVYCQQFSIADLFFLLSFIDLFNSIDRTIFYVNFKKLVTS